MDLIPAIKTLIEKNVWISAGFLGSGILLLKLSDATVLIRFINRLFSASSYNFVENLFVISGLVSLAASFYTFYVWITAYSKKRNAARKIAVQQAAQTMGWTYSEYPTGRLRTSVNSFITSRALGVPGHLHSRSQHTLNFLYTEIDGDLLVIFDLAISAANDTGESFTEFETVYLVASDKLDLPYFQTQPESFIGDNAVGTYLKKKAGVNDIDFPQRPVFSEKYVVDGSFEAISRAFTPAVFDFYEQNQLYRTIGDGKMLCLICRQIDPIDQIQINTQLQALHQLYQLLKSQ